MGIIERCLGDLLADIVSKCFVSKKVMVQLEIVKKIGMMKSIENDYYIRLVISLGIKSSRKTDGRLSALAAH